MPDTTNLTMHSIAGCCHWRIYRYDPGAFVRL